MMFQSTLFIAPPLESYDWSCFTTQVATVANVQLVNASLAIQLANAWLWQHKSGLYFLIGIYRQICVKKLSYILHIAH
jgi:hypothetical protein